MKNIAILASGSGTNAENIAKYFEESNLACVKLILSNRKDAFVLERAKRLNIDAQFFSRTDFLTSEKILHVLQAYEIDFLVLAGFLLLVPDNLLKAYPNRIVNIHPALLPKYGGKGMYGDKVHQAVVAAGEKESGITIHYVDEHYDAGQPIFQASCAVVADDTPESLAQKVHALEYEYFPRVIADIIKRLP